MDLNLAWHGSLPLTDDSKNNGVYAADLNAIPETPGIYVFLRVHGKTAECLYVGKATKLRTRVKAELNNSKLMQGIKKSATGKRHLFFAEFKARQGQQENRSLLTIKRTLIRYYLARGDQLLNIQGTRLVKDSVTSERPTFKKFLPQVIFFEK